MAINPFLPNTQPRGLQYKPLSPGRSVFAGGLQGLGQYLLALGSGQPQQAAAAFQGGLQGFEEGQYRRQQASDYADDREYRRKRQEADDAERAEKKAKATAAEAKWGELQGLFADDDPTNDPTGLRDILQFLDADSGYGVVADLFPDAPEPYSPLAKLRADLDAGRIDQATYDAAVLKENYIPPQQPREVKIPGITTLYGRDGQPVSLRENDPRIDQLLAEGFVETAPKSPEGGKPPSAADLRAEYVKATKDYEQAAYGYGKVVSAASDPSPAGDIALIFGFMKTLDPNSTVREGEFATAQNAGSVPERIASLYNSVVQGTRLTEAQRKDFINQAKGQFSVYENRKKVADDFYTGLSERNQISPQDVIVPYGEVPRYLPDPTGGPDERGAPVIIDDLKIRKVQ